MTSFGFTLSSEERGPAELVSNAARAEDAGFEFCAISDHFHPWIQEQGHSPFVWAVLGGVAKATRHIEVGTAVTCPILRVHPTAVAHASATAALLFEGRFFLGLGTGEALNEHVTGERWPPPDTRLEMLEEAIGVIRQLWSGETIDYRGTYYTVENARLFDPPSTPPRIVVSGFGPRATELAARRGDGYFGHGPKPEPVEQYHQSGGRGPTYAQIDVCYGADEDACRETTHRYWPNSGFPGQLAQDLPTWTHFEQLASLVSVDAAARDVPCGPNLDGIVELTRSYRDAGYDHLYFHQIGPDQDAFFEIWESELGKALAEL